jgi:organic hydroperoxide reductase OsmC/OhrA
VEWTGNTGKGTVRPNAYSKNHVVRAEGRPEILASSDPAFNGDPDRYNPEELLVAALGQCHMLWFLSRCAKHGVVVTEYVDDAIGTMVEHRDGGGEFVNVTLRPRITLASPADAGLLARLHEESHHLCFIARSVNFPVVVESTYEDV